MDQQLWRVWCSSGAEPRRHQTGTKAPGAARDDEAGSGWGCAGRSARCSVGAVRVDAAVQYARAWLRVYAAWASEQERTRVAEALSSASGDDAARGLAEALEAVPEDVRPCAILRGLRSEFAQARDLEGVMNSASTVRGAPFAGSLSNRKH